MQHTHYTKQTRPSGTFLRSGPNTNRYLLRSVSSLTYRTVDAKTAVSWLRSFGFNRQGVIRLLGRSHDVVLTISGAHSTLESFEN